MKLGVLTVPLYSMPLADALAYIKKHGAEVCEIGCGGFPGRGHCDPEILLNDPKALEDFKQTIADSGLGISALSCHTNPVHPDKNIADTANDHLHKAVLMAEKLGINTINTFSGCPGDSPDSKYPNWVTCPWPDDFLKILDYQWNDVLIPYWKEFVKFAEAHGVTKIAFEPHPGFCVYNPETVMRIRDAVGPQLGANLDPSHLIWQGINLVEAIKYLGDAIFHFHAKDTKIDLANTGVNGVLDTKLYSDEMHRSWIFRTVGYGNNESFWREVISALRLVGYDGAISIEYEDSLMSSGEGLRKACEFLNSIIIKEPKGEMFWA